MWLLARRIDNSLTRGDVEDPGKRRDAIGSTFANLVLLTSATMLGAS